MDDTSFPTESSVLGNAYLSAADIPALQISMPEQPTLKMYQDGRVFWKDHFIEGDDEFKQAIIEFSRFITGKCPRCCNDR